MRQHKVFLRHELLKYNSEKSTAKSSALENYISSANLSLSGCSSAEPNSVSVGRCKFQLKKLYLQTVKKVDHLPMYENAKEILKNYSDIFLFLDNDLAGRNLMTKFSTDFPEAVDCAYIYAGFNDLNDYLIQQTNEVQHEYKSTFKR